MNAVSENVRHSDSMIKEAAHQCIYQILADDFKALVDVAGAKNALKAYQPMGEYSGHAIAQNFCKRLELKKNDAETVSIPLYAFVNNMIGWSSEPPKVRELGIEVMITSCGMAKAGAPPELCAGISHNAGLGVAKEINPEYEIIYTHHPTHGVDHCRYIVKRKDVRIKNLDDLGPLIRTSPEIVFPEDEKEALTTSYTCSNWVNTVNAMLVALGPDATMRELLTVSKKRGGQFGKEISALLGLEGSGPEAIEKVIETIGSAMGQEHKVVKKEPQTILTEISGCALSDGPNEACRQFEELIRCICATIDPEFEIGYEKMRTRGETTCMWKICRKRDSSIEAKESTRDVEENALALLKTRLVKGEITIEQYHQIKDIITNK